MSPPVYLDNSNIITYAADYIYSGGEVKFFIISKDAVMDYPHGARSIVTETPLYFTDIAGDNMFTSSNIYSGITIASFDTFNDVDFYKFIPISTYNLTISTTCLNNYDINCEIYDYNGNIIASDTTVGQVNKTINVIQGRNYFIKIYNNDQQSGDYSITLS